MRTHVIRCLAAVALVLPAVAPRGASGAPAWWNYEWKCRRLVTLPKTTPTRLGGDDIAVVTIPTGGRTRPDAADVRVTTAFSRREMASRVLMTGPGDKIRVAFAIQGGVTAYFVYYGNPKPLTRPGDLAIRRGVLLKTWKHPGGRTPRELLHAKAILAKARTFIGSDFVDRVFMGHNPFGPQEDLVSTFVGYLRCTRTGKHAFSISSQNASFLTVDDKLVVANGGSHGAYRDIRKNGEVYLRTGLHKLTFYHVSSFGSPVAVLAWRPPGEKRISVIPPGAFAPVVRGKGGAMEELGKVAADFTPVHAGEVFMMNRYYQRYVFEAVTTGVTTGRAKVDWTWDFGDGETARGAKVEHVYFRQAMRTVTLKGEVRGAPLARSNAIYVTRPWQTVTKNRLDSIKDHARIAATYSFKKLDSESLVDAIHLFRRTERTKDLTRVGEAFVSRKKVAKGTASQLVPVYADALLAAGQGDKALKALIAGAAVETSPAGWVELLVRAGQVSVEPVGNPRQARALFNDVLKKAGSAKSSPWVRRARIGIGDSWRALGEHAKARDAYAAAGPAMRRRSGGAALTRGDFARQVEDYIRNRSFSDAADTLDEWQYALPMDKLTGYWSLLRVKMLVQKRSYLPAVREAETLVGVTPTSHHAPELLLQAAEAYRFANKFTEAAAVLKRIINEYPESALAAKAADLLKG